MNRCLAVAMALIPHMACASEIVPWTSREKEDFTVGCSRAIATLTFNDYLKRRGLAEPAAADRENMIAKAAAGPARGICRCVTDEVSKRWSVEQVNSQRPEMQRLIVEFGNSKCGLP
jgi:hypothetical protein